MSRRNSLPSSLELLLDTMCNTFGGIVFIAIALVIITQVSQKVLTETSKLRGTPEAKQMLREQNAQLEQEIAELTAELQEEAIRMARCSTEKRAKIEALQQTRLDLALAQQKMEDIAEKFNELQEKKEEVTQKRQELQELVSSAEEKLQRMQEERQLDQETLDALKKQVEKLKKENRSLKMAGVQTGQDVFTIRFSLETNNSGLRQCVVLLRNGRIYVDKMNLSWKKSMMIIEEALFNGKGYDIGSQELSQALSQRPRTSYQIDIWADNRSFDTLVALRQILRERQYQVSWAYTKDDFRFVRTDYSRNSSF